MPRDFVSLLSEDRPGRLYFGGVRMVLLDIESAFWTMRRQIEALVGQPLSSSVLQQAGARGGASFARSFVQQPTLADQSRAFRECVAAYQAAGFGRFEIDHLEWPIGRLLIRASDTVEAWMVQQHEHQADAPVCAYTAGVLVGFVHAVSGRRDVVCIEQRCQAQGADACVFELLPAATAGDSSAATFDPDPSVARHFNLLELVFDRMPMGIIVLDRSLRVRRFNPTWADFVVRHSPLTADQVRPGVSFFDLTPGTESQIMPIFERVLAGETIRQEAFQLELGGMRSCWNAVYAPLVEYEQVVGIVHVITDVTEQVRAEIELRQHRDHLEELVQERTAELYAANERLQREIAERQQTEDQLRSAHAELEKRSRQLSTLLDVSRHVTSTLEMEPLLNVILDQLQMVVEYTGATVFALEGDMLRILVHRGPVSPDELIGLRFPLKQARINEEVVRLQEPVIIADVLDDTPLAYAFQATAGPRLRTTFRYIRSWLGVPLSSKERVMGLLTLDHSEPNVYTAAQAALVLAFAQQAAVALENARLYDETRQRADETRTLLAVQQALTSRLDAEAVLQMIADEARRLTGTLFSTVFLLEGDELRVSILSGESGPGLFVGYRMPVKGSATGLAVLSGQPVCVEDAMHDQRVNRDVVTRAALRSLLAAPLLLGDRKIGAISVGNKRVDMFNAHDEWVLTMLASGAVIALENARLYAQSQQSAAMEERQRLARELHDAVTQTLFSASLIAEVLPRLWERQPDETRRRLEELRQLTRGALAEMRTLLLELRPTALVEARPGDLLRQLGEAITGRSRLPIAVFVEGDAVLPPDVQVGIYRIAQEALNNVVKHARASNVSVRLVFQPDAVVLTVEDDGCGFDLDHVAAGHLGLGIMRERAAAIGAILQIDSRPGSGTRLSMVWGHTSAPQT